MDKVKVGDRVRVQLNGRSVGPGLIVTRVSTDGVHGLQLVSAPALHWELIGPIPLQLLEPFKNRRSGTREAVPL